MFDIIITSHNFTLKAKVPPYVLRIGKIITIIIITMTLAFIGFRQVTFEGVRI